MRRAALVLALLLTACGGGLRAGPAAITAPKSKATTAVPDPTTAAPETTTTLATPLYEVASAEVSRVRVYAAPGDDQPVRSFANPNPTYDTPRVFLVKERKDDWLNVYLPSRPNGVTGWIRSSDVTTFKHPFRIVVELGAHRLTAFDGNQVFLDEPVGVGQAATPTTTGLFYTTELIEVLPYQQSAYGPYAYGLSAYSEVLYSFGAGDGQMGIHGTGDPSSVGRDVSNGCIRMNNAAITQLAEKLPVGVPVEIRA